MRQLMKGIFANHLKNNTMELNLVLPLNLTTIDEQLTQLSKEIKQEKDLYRKHQLLMEERTILKNWLDRVAYLNAN